MTTPGRATEPPAGPLDVASYHRQSDLDSSPLAQHHSLGYNPNKASPGDHDHDGKNSKSLGLIIPGGTQLVTDLGTTVNAVTLPQSYPEGFSIGVGPDASGWGAMGASLCIVHTTRNGNDVTQTAYSVSNSGIWRRYANTAGGNVWTAWVRTNGMAILGGSSTIVAVAAGGSTNLDTAAITVPTTGKVKINASVGSSFSPPAIGKASGKIFTNLNGAGWVVQTQEWSEQSTLYASFAAGASLAVRLTGYNFDGVGRDISLSITVEG